MIKLKTNKEIELLKDQILEYINESHNDLSEWNAGYLKVRLKEVFDYLDGLQKQISTCAMCRINTYDGEIK